MSELYHLVKQLQEEVNRKFKKMSKIDRLLSDTPESQESQTFIVVEGQVDLESCQVADQGSVEQRVGSWSPSLPGENQAAQ